MPSSGLTRRETLAALGVLPLTGWSLRSGPPAHSTIESFLGEMVLTRQLVDHFLDPEQPNWAMFDPELGYRHHDTVMKDGIDGSYAVYTMEPTGERRRVNYRNKPCRINTYGDSFTHCDQVSDAETWQEYLAAHFAEPVRNFGVGGYGVYQAYRRMLREEKTAAAAPYVILNVWIDDHRRSLMASRWFHLKSFRDRINRQGDRYFHTNPWCHARLNPETGQLVEHINSHPTPESLYRLCDTDYLIETFKDDLFVQIEYAMQGGKPARIEDMRRLAELLQMPGDWRTPEGIAQTAGQLFWVCGMRASEQIVTKARSFAEQQQKKLMVLLSYRGGDIVAACRQQPRIDRTFVEFLRGSGIAVIDSMEKHVQDFPAFSLQPEQYVQRYYHGHYAPAGNHFFAFAIKNDLLGWLDPKPVTYGSKEPSIADIAATLAE